MHEREKRKKKPERKVPDADFPGLLMSAKKVGCADSIIPNMDYQ